MQVAGQLVFVEDDIAAYPGKLVAHATALTVPRTPNGILGYAGFRAVLHPRDSVAVGIEELAAPARPSRR